MKRRSRQSREACLCEIYPCENRERESSAMSFPRKRESRDFLDKENPLLEKFSNDLT